ncbi:Uncharacterized protein BP5553_04952 [Venustampulla echinocandica]|uniref:WKF domain-containing protein n=1 Tax=Venustampulla echinocandica TaxID=2656787 RepID=A0A370TPS8_9HELO|nr:Uncharacterized protein BP5553_04952 [Venustampulla echinocandica]RDL37519.1 Uncharacterized protein BP5553_04952 [Venustampulla echinocandica]
MPSATAPNASPRIPAWRRLGLKLKSAPEPSQAATVVEPSQNIDTPKRKRLDETDDATPAKKKKSSKDSRNLSGAEQATPKLARKKSVTFTPETKVEDGDSIKQLFGAWAAEQKSQNLSAPVFTTPEPSRVEEQIDTTLDEKVRRTKRVKKPEPEKTSDPKATVKAKKKKGAKTTDPADTPQRPFLAYLRLYSDSREKWKFNKNHQNHLLKHLFDIDSVPSEYETLIYSYVRGLRGGVRTRLRDSALAIKIKDQEEGAAGFPENMADRDARQIEYEVAMKEYVATMMAVEAPSNIGYEEGILGNLSDAAMPTRTAKRMRAERVLAELGAAGDEAGVDGGSKADEAVPEDENQKRIRMNDGSSQKVSRKRKQRTAAADGDSSSEDDSSSSDESSSEDDSTTEVDDGDDTSSSSSSSSSSGSDSSDSEESSEDSEESESE